MSKEEKIFYILRDVAKDGTGDRNFLEAQAKKIVAVMEEGAVIDIPAPSDGTEDADEPTV
jgi:hypothetical protein